ncbi:MAG TPA: hypothetical protein VFQ67_11815 [Allosphingosinicella sp.]|jgi:hypothetical protein|nr:hypothetical protein [Allosphingosinicella sp.]
MERRRALRGLLPAAAAASLSACGLIGVPRLPPEPPEAGMLEGRLTPLEQAHLGGHDVETGVALSGGGFRSALFTVGALKALYDRKLIGGRADIVSTVSGGGYAAYWVYANQLELERGRPTPVERFGSATFDDSRFYARVCELAVNAKFVTGGAMIRSAVLGKSVKLYRERLGVVFGAADEPPVRLDKLDARTRGGAWPFLVVNATLNREATTGRRPTGWKDGLFEFTPLGTRWNGDGELAWKGSSLPYRDAVAVSGAAFARFLKQEVRQPNGRRLVLHDGGGSENLGAIALIRRGIPNIVIVDAEHDPAYRFKAYSNLKKRLPAWGASIVVEDIDDHLASRSRRSPPAAYFQGYAEARRPEGGPSRVSRIHYIKMSLPRGLAAALSEARKRGVGRRFHERYMAEIDRSWNPAEKSFDCSQVADERTRLADWFGYAVSGYENFWGKDPRSKPRLGAFTLDFPQYSTGDQSMFQDQALAFIALGYLLTEGSGAAAP